MKLLTKAIEAKLRRTPLLFTRRLDFSPVLVKFFTPDSSWTWYVLEAEQQADGDWEFFGLVDGHEKELGYFRLSDLQSVRGGIGLPVERDLYFDGYQVKKSTNEVLRIEVMS